MQNSFWNMSTGEKPKAQSEYETAGQMDPIPANTQLLAIIDEAQWRAAFEIGNPDYIQLRWTVLAPADYKNRKIFQKLHVLDTDANKADRAKQMLMAIDTNAGGKLSKLDREPEDHELLSALANKQMLIRVQVWKTGDDDNVRTGNWVNAVAPKAKAATKTASQPARKQANKPAPVEDTLENDDPGVDTFDDEDIPF